jgi:hypothetical protein
MAKDELRVQTIDSQPGAGRHWQHRTAGFTGPQPDVGIKRFHERFQLSLNVADVEPGLVDLGIALFAEPGKAVLLLGPAFALDY